MAPAWIRTSTRRRGAVPAGGAEATIAITPEAIGADKERLNPPLQVLCQSVMTAFYIRHLPAVDRLELLGRLQSDTGRKRRDLVISATLCNADGTQRFTPEVFALVKKMADRDAERFHKTACRINGIEYIPTKAK